MHTVRQETGVYYYQRRIPLDLQADFGKTKLGFSLRTKDRETAKAKARLHSVELDAKFQAIRRQRERLQAISDSDLQVIAMNEANYQFDQIEKDISGKVLSERENLIDDLSIAKEQYSDALDGNPNELKHLTWQLDELKERHLVPKNLPKDKEQRLVFYWLRNMVEVYTRFLNEYSKPWEQKRANKIDISHARVPELGQAAEEYLEDIRNDKTKYRNPKYMDKPMVAARALVAMLGAETKLKDIRYKELRIFRDLLIRFPSNVNLKRETRNLPLEEVFKLIPSGKFDHLPSLSPKTVNAYMQKVKELLDFAVRNDWIMSNPYDPKLLISDEVKRAEKRLAFTSEQLQKILRNRQEDDFFKWGTRLALGMGLRLNEICQLEKANFQEVDNILCVKIASLEGQRAKTKASRRTLPIPQKILDLGFEEWLATRPNKGLIFNLSSESSGGYLSSKISQEFNRTLVPLGIRKPDGNGQQPYTFHSFRHTFRDAFRAKAQEIPKEIAEILGGWTVDKVSVADDYGSGLPVAEKKRYLDMIEFEAF
ncbi:tyrosine-type recombinase/integrase [Paraneptunicella aestuarii]|uniref:DUF6538 domain-containing protein n=1 Tax=Paraneptunicella aestuarii TaxID=2831148 RepID=UPI001E2C5C77|nr:DUF6538 domain-containing protein [Paraneptunicella aestuarii]UAA39604.1 tyrosine-type recombinase/integrase [Paraneptunicella aestuarii]